jgi:FkbM family methyltransferase
VITFEPVRHHRERLRQNLRLNSLENTVEILDFALGNSQGTVWLNVNPLGAADNAWISDKGSVEAPLTTLDQLVREKRWSGITFIKIDTEGYDSKVIDGAAATICQWRPVILTEFLREGMARNGLSIDPCWDFLVRELNYTCGRLEGNRFIKLETPGHWENLFFLPCGFER